MRERWHAKLPTRPALLPFARKSLNHLTNRPLNFAERSGDFVFRTGDHRNLGSV
jgi:hypothetical protein